MSNASETASQEPKAENNSQEHNTSAPGNEILELFRKEIEDIKTMIGALEPKKTPEAQKADPVSASLQEIKNSMSDLKTFVMSKIGEKSNATDTTPAQKAESPVVNPEQKPDTKATINLRNTTSADIKNIFAKK